MIIILLNTIKSYYYFEERYLLTLILLYDLIKMRRFFKLILVAAAISIVSIIELNAQESSNNIVDNYKEGKLKPSPFGIGLDLQTKYVWRGMEMMTEESTPVLFLMGANSLFLTTS